MRVVGRPSFGALPMASSLLRSGYAILEYEIAQEKASTLGRLGRGLEAAVTALAACPRTAHSDQKIRNRLVEQADMRSGTSSCNARPAVSTTSPMLYRSMGCRARCMTA